MRTYLSIDCDYFADVNTHGAVSAQYLIDVLKMLDKPVYITLGHDLHAFDVSHRNVEKLINVDMHCDCDEQESYRMPKFWDGRPATGLLQTLHDYSKKEALSECDWIHFCKLTGKTPRVEHWQPRDGNYHSNCYHNKSINLVTGVASFKTKVIPPSKLLGQVKRIKGDIVGVGLAISPFWCYDVSHPSASWIPNFFETLETHGVINDKTLYDMDNVGVNNRCYAKDIRKIALPYKRTELAPNVWFSPLRRGRKQYRQIYAMGDGKYGIKIAAVGVIPYLPSIKQAAIALSQWTPWT